MISKSPDKNKHWADRYLSDSEYSEVFKTIAEHQEEQESDPKWQKNNLEYDLRTSEYIINKVRSSEDYGDRLYGTLCNNEFIKREMWQVLKEETWGCSWRYAGGILADIMGKGDYMDWYCGGLEGTVDEEVEQDLYNLGWLVVHGENTD